LEKPLFEVKPLEPATLAVAPAVLGVALLATYIPARRAMKVAPGEVLGRE
jgi:ABC-type lipoprotein release transport system permease subunit